MEQEMKYVSVDIETSGLSPWCQILEIGAVLDDTDWANQTGDYAGVDKLPRFHTYVQRSYDDSAMKQQPCIVGEPYALAMHSAIFKRLANPTAEENKAYTFTPHYRVFDVFKKWLTENGITGKIVPAGKNFAGFDKQFLGNLQNFDVDAIFSHRTIDPAMMFWNAQKDTDLPSSKVCMERAGLAGEVAHTALEDALMVVKLIRVGLTMQQRIV